jgi:hypothetical protein
MEYEYEKWLLTKPNYWAYIFAITNHFKRTNQRNVTQQISYNKDVSDMSEDELLKLIQWWQA